ncbi:MAG: DUF1549 domain-containing protein [Planctomycetes bacterium]|nr:DUF1549 domain-containing protein [Planctomycetota bacterium]
MPSRLGNPKRLRSFSAFAIALTVVANFGVASAATPVAPTPLQAKPSASAPNFETHVRPILKAHCFHCHGEEEKLQGGLDLRLVRLITKGGDSGSSIVAGKHAESLLFQRIADGEMPPGEKKLSVTERETIARWLDGGARTLKPEPASIAEFTEEERAFWSLQPVRAVSPPSVKQANVVRTPIDAFLLAELERKSLQFSPEADPATLIRRVTFDLIGLPPTPEEVSAFVTAYDKDPKAYEKLIDRLLASPHYGERWGRHWLDVAGYADSDGYSAVDAERKFAYRYRDYVIRSLNNDKPWNEFIVEQLAGDELVRPPYEKLPADQLDKLIATGFLRMGPDGTSDSANDQKLAQNDCVAETLKIVSTSLLGLSVGCAQCHNHRYDPVSQVDYFRFRAIFEPAFNTQNWRVPKARLISTTSDETKKAIAAIDAEIAKVNAEKTAELNKLMDETFELALKKIPEKQHAEIRQARSTEVGKRTDAQKKILKDNPSVNITATGVRQQLGVKYRAWETKYTKVLDDLRAKRPEEEYVQALTEVPGKPPATFVHYRGDHLQRRQVVTPGELSIFASAPKIAEKDATLPSTGRRLAYARYLTDGKHPLVARVLVNRFWMHHFGRGIVASPGDFGALGDRPTHPELLDWLAADFVKGGWKLKPFHKQIMMSTAYRQSSRRTPQLDAVDPDNLLLGRMSIRRLEAETLRDAVLATTGKLNRKQFGPPVPVSPDETGQVVIGVDTRDTAGRPTGKKVDLGEEPNRRSIYIQSRRSLPLGMLETFDAPVMTPNCECRASSTVTPQSLLLMNSEFIVTQATEFAKRLRAAAPDDLASQVRSGAALAFGVRPSEADVSEAIEFVKAQTAALESVAKAAAAEQALACYCQALLSANKFLYVD